MRITRLALTLPGSLALSFAVACAPATATNSPRITPQLTAADFRDTNDPIDVIIARKVTGVVLVRTASGESILRIRGRSAFSESEDGSPMYVIDGTTIRSAGSPLTNMNPHDIESITVLKGPEGAIYGTDALNGVIVVVTKRGGRATP